MASVSVYNKEGKEVEKIDLNDSVFAAPVNEHLVHMAVVLQLANKRQGTQKAKTRSEVRGGGRKPWRQKGTGHARQGSIRAPQWTGGGVVFAPVPRDYSFKMNKKEDMIMYQWMKKYLDPICPLFAILPLLSCFGLNMLIYSGTMVMCADWYHYDLTTSLDQAIPLVPGWMYIYFGCFLFWTVNYIMVARINRNDPDTFYRFVAADMISRLVCGIIFMVFPTTNVRPEVTGTGFSVFLLQFLYGLDQPTNLFPSIHCLVSWFCFLGIKDQKRIPTWYKGVSFTLAVLVFLSTIFTKQHVLVD